MRVYSNMYLVRVSALRVVYQIGGARHILQVHPVFCHTTMMPSEPANMTSETGAAQANHCYTMDDVVEKIGFGRFHRQLTLLCGVGYFAGKSRAPARCEEKIISSCKLLTNILFALLLYCRDNRTRCC